MNTAQFEIVDGPDKPALQRALAYPNSQRICFTTPGDAIEVEVRRIDEMGDGLSFGIFGIIRSGANRDRSFEAIYSVEGRTGTFKVG